MNDMAACFRSSQENATVGRRILHRLARASAEQRQRRVLFYEEEVAHKKCPVRFTACPSRRAVGNGNCFAYDLQAPGIIRFTRRPKLDKSA